MVETSQRELRQMIGFYGTGLATLAACIVVRRSVAARRFRPLMFDANHRPPNFNMMKDAVQAVSNASVLSVSTFAFSLATVSWISDVATLQEFGTMMKSALGGAQKEKELREMPIAQDVAEMEGSLNDALTVKKNN